MEPQLHVSVTRTHIHLPDDSPRMHDGGICVESANFAWIIAPRFLLVCPYSLTVSKGVRQAYYESIGEFMSLSAECVCVCVCEPARYDKRRSLKTQSRCRAVREERKKIKHSLPLSLLYSEASLCVHVCVCVYLCVRAHM